MRRSWCEFFFFFFWGGGRPSQGAPPLGVQKEREATFRLSRARRKVFFLLDLFRPRIVRCVVAPRPPLFFLSPLLPPNSFSICASSTCARGQDAQRRQGRVFASANLGRHRGRRRCGQARLLELLLACRGRWALAARAFWLPSHISEMSVLDLHETQLAPRLGQKALCARGSDCPDPMISKGRKKSELSVRRRRTKKNSRTDGSSSS